MNKARTRTGLPVSASTGHVAIRPRLDRPPRELWRGLILSLLALLVGLLIPLIQLDSAPLLIYLAVLVSALAVATMRVRYRGWGVGDPLLLFAVFFAVYNASILLEIGINALPNAPEPYFLDGYHSLDDFVNAGIASVLAAAGLLFATWFLPRLRQRPLSQTPLDVPCGHRTAGRLFWIGAGTLVASMALTLLIVIIIVGPVAFLAASRAGVRIEPSLALGFGIPIIPFYIAAFACMSLGYYASPSRRRFIALVALMALFTVFSFVQGDRHFVAYMLLIVFGAYVSLVARKRVSFRKLVVLAISAYLVFALISTVRVTLSNVIGGTATLADLAEDVSSFSWQRMLPSRIEFAGPYLTLMDTLLHPTGPLLGKTYAGAALFILPTRFYPGVKPNSIAQDFAYEVAARTGRFQGVGFGFSPVAEAFLNFGLRGIPFIFAAFAIVFHWIGTLRFRGMFGMLTYLVALPEVLNMNRISTDGMLQEVVFSLIVVWILSTIARAHHK